MSKLPPVANKGLAFVRTAFSSKPSAPTSDVTHGVLPKVLRNFTKSDTLGRQLAERMRKSGPASGAPTSAQSDPPPSKQSEADSIPDHHWNPFEGPEATKRYRPLSPRSADERAGTVSHQKLPPVPAKAPDAAVPQGAGTEPADQAPIHMSETEIHSPRPTRISSLVTADPTREAQFSPIPGFNPIDFPPRTVSPDDEGPATPSSGGSSAPSPAVFSADGQTSGTSTPVSAILSSAPDAVFGDADHRSATMVGPFKPTYDIPEQEPHPATPPPSTGTPVASPATSLMDGAPTLPPRSDMARPVSDPPLPRPPSRPASPSLLAQSTRASPPLGNSNGRRLDRPASARSASSDFSAKLGVARGAWKDLEEAINRFSGADPSSFRKKFKDIRDNIRNTYRSTRGVLSAELPPRELISEARKFAEQYIGRSMDDLANSFLQVCHDFKQVAGEILHTGQPPEPGVPHKVDRAYLRTESLGHVLAESGIDGQLKERQATLESLLDPASPKIGDNEQVQALANQLLDDIQNLERQKDDLNRSMEGAFSGAVA